MWGKIIGGVAGFAMGGPWGAVAGVALGHAAESGGLAGGGLGRIGTAGLNFAAGLGAAGSATRGAARLAAMRANREQLFAVSVVVLAAKLARCDGPVNRAEIDGFKRHFRIPPESARDVGRLFDQARDSTEGFETYATQLGEAFSDNRGVLEDVLAALFAIARADKPVNGHEQGFLTRVCHSFALGPEAWARAAGTAARPPPAEEESPYAILGVTPDTPDDALRAAWRQLMRENHPDSLASRGVPAEFIARATDKVARINAAWDRIKRERGL